MSGERKTEKHSKRKPEIHRDFIFQSGKDLSGDVDTKTLPLGDEYVPSGDVASARKTQAKTLPLGDEYEYEFSTSTEEVMGHG